jgi:Ca2+-transporting ATPase
LQEKLQEICDQVTDYAMIVTVLVILTQGLYMVIKTLAYGDKQLFDASFLADIAKIAILALSIMIVAIPEGLPICVQIAMALSVSKLKSDNILIKKL